MSDNPNRQDKSGTPDHGPTEAPPNLPRGWIAQWDAKAGKYYFVQLSTSHAQWELPTEPAPGVDTPSSTPMSGGNSQFPRPSGSPNQSHVISETSRGLGSDGGGESERGLGSVAVNMIAGKQGHGSHQSGLTGLAQSFLSSQGSHTGSHNTSGGSAGAVAASLISNVLGSGAKPHGQPHSGNQFSTGSGGSGDTHHSGQSGAGHMLSGLFGSHNSHSQQSQYGYSSGPAPAGGYSGATPPAQYQPGSYNQQSYGSTNDHYSTTTYHGQNDHSSQTQPGNHYESGQSEHHYGIQRPDDPSKPFYVGGTPFDEPSHSYGSSQQSQTSSSNYAQGSQGAYPPNQYGGHPQPYGVHHSGQYDPHSSSSRPSQYGQADTYSAQNQQYPPPPPQSGYRGGSQGSGFGANPRY